VDSRPGKRATTMGMPANLAAIPLPQIRMPTSAAAIGLGCLRPFIRAVRSFPSAREKSTDIPGVKCWSGYSRPR